MVEQAAWYVVHSKPNKEGELNAYLQSIHVETYYPTLRVKPANPRARKILPYFPRYLFVHVDLAEVGLSTFKWAPGAIRLLKFGDYPVKVSDAVISEIKERLLALEVAGASDVVNRFKKGDPVRITGGPLAGYEALFDLQLSGTERVQILLEMLGRQVYAQIDANLIEKKRSV